MRFAIRKKFRDLSGRGLWFSEALYSAAINSVLAPLERDPVAEWLDSLPAWDGTDRIPRMLHECLGADDTRLNEDTGLASDGRDCEPYAQSWL